MAAERVRRIVKERGQLIDGQFILHVNNYDLEAGERSVWDQELAVGGGKQLVPQPIKKLPKFRDPNQATKTPNPPSAPRQLSAEEKAREASNAAIKASRAGAEGARRHFFWQHRQRFAAFGASVAAPRAGVDLPGEFVPLLNQPPYIRVAMRDYQLQGLRFLAQAHANGVSAILGDEMGLGKTLQTISFLAHLKFELGVGGPHLIVAPLSVLSSWMTEFKRFCPELKVIKLHSSDPTERDRLKNSIKRVGDYDVAVTTYEMVKAPAMASVLAHRMHWRYMVLDEGHVIKNEASQISQAVRGFHFQNALLLTGTPLQNNLRELFALLNFLFPEQLPLSVAPAFDHAFDLNSGADGHRVDDAALLKAHRLLQPLMLRRLKAEVEGRLPPKLETTILCPLSNMQVFWYKRLLLKEAPAMLAQLEIANGKDASSSSSSSSASASDGQEGARWKRLQSLMMQLRKCANHPYLFDGADPGPTDERLVEASGKLKMLDRLLPKLHAAHHRCVVFSQFTQVLDVLDDYMTLRGYKFCRLDGGTNRVQRTVDINAFNAPGSPLFCFLMSTRAGGLGVNLQTADTCILFDSDWNPQPDLQAMARVHRIGQTKKVHVYRLVTPGTVEERIVQRAEKKLYLDKMVNRDAHTQDTSSLDDDGGGSGKGKGKGKSGEEEDASGVSGSDLLAALSFGAQAVFRAGRDEPPTDAELDAIIDRTRTDDFSCGKLTGGEAKTANAFDAEQAAMNLRELQGTTYAKSTQKSFLSCKHDMSDIGSEWAALQSSKRVASSRTVAQHVAGVGLVHVLKQNDYTLGGGEQSVWGRELGASGAAAAASGGGGPRRQLAGRDYDHMDYCLQCRGGDGHCVATAALSRGKGGRCQGRHGAGKVAEAAVVDGSCLVKCGGCAVALHRACAPPTSLLTMAKSVSKQWLCPHHKCSVCNRGTGAAGGLLFRCLSCPKAFCEDHLPSTEGALIVGHSLRFQALGADHPKQACYVVCSPACRQAAAQEGDLPEGLVATTGILAATGVDTTAAGEQRRRRGPSSSSSSSNGSNSGDNGDGTAAAGSLGELLALRAAAAAAVRVGANVRQQFGAPVSGWCEGAVVAALPEDYFAVQFDGPLRGATATYTRAAVARLLVNPPTVVKGKSFSSSSASSSSLSSSSFSSASSSSSPAAKAPAAGAVAVGTRLHKHFPGHGWFQGVVVAVVGDGGAASSSLLYRVEYQDGDAEELLADELSELLQRDRDRTLAGPVAAGAASPSRKGRNRAAAASSAAAAPSQAFARGTFVEVLFDGVWFAGVVDAAVPAGLKVAFSQDQGSKTVVPSEEVAARVRPAKQAATAAEGLRPSVKVGKELPAAKPVAVATAARPFKSDARSDWARLPAESAAALAKARALGPPVPLGLALGPLSLLRRHLVSRAARALAAQRASGGGGGARSGKDVSYAAATEGVARADAALAPALSADETKALVACLERLAPLLCPDLAEDEAALAACTLDDLADRVAAYTGASKRRPPEAAAASLATAQAAAVAAAGAAADGDGLLVAASADETALEYLELVRELETTRKFARDRLAQCLGLVCVRPNTAGYLIKPGNIQSATQLRGSLAAFLAWPRHGLTYVNLDGLLVAVAGVEVSGERKDASKPKKGKKVSGEVLASAWRVTANADAEKQRLRRALQPVLLAGPCPAHLMLLNTALFAKDSKGAAMEAYQTSVRTYRFSVEPPRPAYVYAPPQAITAAISRSSSNGSGVTAAWLATPQVVATASSSSSSHGGGVASAWLATPQVITAASSSFVVVHPVVLLDENGTVLLEFSSQTAAAERLGVSNSTISNAVHGKIPNANGYLVSFKAATSSSTRSASGGGVPARVPRVAGHTVVGARVVRGAAGAKLGMDLAVGAQGWPAVTFVDVGSAAASAGLAQGDLILAVQGAAMGPAATLEPFLARVAAMPAAFDVAIARPLAKLVASPSDLSALPSCAACHQAKVKCDEARPQCARCAQLGLGARVLKLRSPGRLAAKRYKDGEQGGLSPPVVVAVAGVGLSPPPRSSPRAMSPSGSKKRAANGSSGATSPSPSKKRW